MQVALLVTPDVEEKDLGENSDRNRCNACHGGRRQRRRHAAPTARLSTGSSRQDADRQDTRRQKPNRQVTGRNQELLIRAIGSGLGVCQTGEGMSKRLNRLARCPLRGFAQPLLCSSAKFNQLLHTRFTSARLRRMRLTKRNRRTRLERRARDQQRARTTSISGPERRRVGDTLSSGMGGQANGRLKSRALPLRETAWIMYLAM